jgi:hypothetical protein
MLVILGIIGYALVIAIVVFAYLCLFGFFDNNEILRNEELERKYEEFEEWYNTVLEAKE